MAKRPSASSARQASRKEHKAYAGHPHRFLRHPGIIGPGLVKARRVGRSTTGRAKQLFAILIIPRLLAQLRRLAARQRKLYQTLVHELLEAAD